MSLLTDSILSATKKILDKTPVVTFLSVVLCFLTFYFFVYEPDQIEIKEQIKKHQKLYDDKLTEAKKEMKEENKKLRDKIDEGIGAMKKIESLVAGISRKL